MYRVPIGNNNKVCLKFYEELAILEKLYDLNVFTIKNSNN